MKEHIELKKAVVERIDPDILVTKYRPNTDIDEHDAEEIDLAHLTMSQGGEMFIIADLRETTAHLEKSAHEYFVSRGRMIPYTKAIAIVSKQKSNLFTRIFSGSAKTLYPTKEFTTLEDANAWFESLRH